MERCPHARSTGGYSVELDDYIEGADLCTLVDKWCLLESGNQCEIYEELLKEEQPNILIDNNSIKQN